MRLLSGENFELALYSLSAKQSNWIDDLNIEYTSFGLSNDVTKSSGESSKFRYFKAIKELKAFVNKWQPDIVHAHYATSYGMLAYRLRIPETILSLWGSDVYEFPRKSFVHNFYFRRIVRKASVVCSTSRAMAEEAAMYVQREYRITPFGTDMRRFIPAQKKESEVFKIGTVKALEPVYGIDRLLTVFAEFIKSTDFHSELHIYGEGSQREVLEKMAEDLGISAQCNFNGFVRGDALVTAFQSLDVALVLSRNESFGVSAVEAQACGVPTIVSNVGGLPEVCAHEDFIVDGEDTESIVSILQTLTDKNTRKKRGEAARQFVLERYSTEACLKTLKETYDLFEVTKQK